MENMEKKTVKEKVKDNWKAIVAGGAVAIIGVVVGRRYGERISECNMATGLQRIYDDGVVKFFDGDKVISMDEANELVKRKYIK